MQGCHQLDKPEQEGHNQNMVRGFIFAFFFIISATAQVPGKVSDPVLTPGWTPNVDMSQQIPKDSHWWRKPEIMAKARDQRQVFVVVKEDAKLGAGFYSMTGAGTLRATPDFTIKKILEFERLPKISSYFKKVIHQPELDRVFILFEAYGYEARMVVKYFVKEEEGKKIFHWGVIWGGFQGMVGEIELSSLKGDKTEAILLAKFNDKEIPLPNIFKSFILEIIVQQVAKSVRSYVEDEASAAAKGKI